MQHIITYGLMMPRVIKLRNGIQPLLSVVGTVLALVRLSLQPLYQKAMECGGFKLGIITGMAHGVQPNK